MMMKNDPTTQNEVDALFEYHLIDSTHYGDVYDEEALKAAITKLILEKQIEELKTLPIWMGNESQAHIIGERIAELKAELEKKQ